MPAHESIDYPRSHNKDKSERVCRTLRHVNSSSSTWRGDPALAWRTPRPNFANSGGHQATPHPKNTLALVYSAQLHKEPLLNSKLLRRIKRGDTPRVQSNNCKERDVA